jgi:hypothetical protein
MVIKRARLAGLFFAVRHGLVERVAFRMARSWLRSNVICVSHDLNDEHGMLPGMFLNDPRRKASRVAIMLPAVSWWH